MPLMDRRKKHASVACETPSAVICTCCPEARVPGGLVFNAALLGGWNFEDVRPATG